MRPRGCRLPGEVLIGGIVWMIVGRRPVDKCFGEVRGFFVLWCDTIGDFVLTDFIVLIDIFRREGSTGF